MFPIRLDQLRASRAHAGYRRRPAASPVESPRTPRLFSPALRPRPRPWSHLTVTRSEPATPADVAGTDHRIQSKRNQEAL
jgi:hypothetical protein